MTSVNAEGHDVLLTTMESGAWFGEIALLERTPRTGTNYELRGGEERRGEKKRGEERREEGRRRGWEIGGERRV